MVVMEMFHDERAVVSTLMDGTNAGFNGLVGVAVDANGFVFAAERTNQRIRKVTAGGGTRIGRVTLRACCADICVERPS